MGTILWVLKSVKSQIYFKKEVHPCFAEMTESRDFDHSITIKVYMFNISNPLEMAAIGRMNPLAGFIY